MRSIRRIGSNDGYGNTIQAIRKEEAQEILGQLFIGDTIAIINKRGTRVKTMRLI